MSIGKSFIRGPRFAFRDTSRVCLPCIFGERYRRGAAHTCADACYSCFGFGKTCTTLEGAVSELHHFETCEACGGTGRVSPAAGIEPTASATA